MARVVKKTSARKAKTKSSLKDRVKRAANILGWRKRGLSIQERLKAMRGGRKSSKSPQRPPLFPLYAEVTVVRDKELMGEHGIILGRGRLATGGRTYVVLITSKGETYYLPHIALRTTGTVFAKADIYTGHTLRVRVDQATGEGRLAS